MSRYKVVLAEDNLLVRAGLQTVLAEADDLDLVASCASFDELNAAVAEYLPDVVLTDIRMPPSFSDEGIQAAIGLRQTHPEVGVVVLSQFVDPGLALQLVAGGSERRGYLLKDRLGDVDELCRVLRTVAGGGSYIDPTVVDALITDRARRDGSPLTRLTPREREVLTEIATGSANSAVAERLFISERAVEKHINSIFAKLDLTEMPSLHRRVSAVLILLRDQT